MHKDLACLQTGLISKSNFRRPSQHEVWKNEFTRSRFVLWSLGDGPVHSAERIFNRTIKHRTVQQQFRGSEPIRLQRVAEPEPDSGYDQPEQHESEPDPRHDQPEHHEPEFQLAGRFRIQLEPDRSAERHQPEFAELDQPEFDFAELGHLAQLQLAEFKQPERQQHVA